MNADMIPLNRSSRRKEAHSLKSEIRNPKSGIDRSLLTSAATALTAALAALIALGLPAAEPQVSGVSVLVHQAANVPKAGPPAQSTVAATNAPPAGTTNSMDALDSKHTLAIGDRLSFRIVEDEEEPRSLFVTDLGELEVPYIGRFPVLGKSCRDLARALKAELEKEYYYQATVILAVDLMTRSRGKVYLVGPVRAPGPQEIPSDELFTLSKAILRAGGFGDYADKNKVRVSRKAGSAGGPDQTFIINVTDILEKGKTDSDLTLEPGDFIYIPERLIRF